MKKECEKAIKIDYGLQILPDTVLHIANLEGLEMFLQLELKAIKDGCKYSHLPFKLYVNEGKPIEPNPYNFRIHMHKTGDE